jgi:hypothetical protein
LTFLFASDIQFNHLKKKSFINTLFNFSIHWIKKKSFFSFIGPKIKMTDTHLMHPTSIDYNVHHQQYEHNPPVEVLSTQHASPQQQYERQIPPYHHQQQQQPYPMVKYETIKKKKGNRLTLIILASTAYSSATTNTHIELPTSRAAPPHRHKPSS